MPKRIQRRRVKGYRLPSNAVSIARPSLLGNPFPFTPSEDRGAAIQKFRDWLDGKLDDQYLELVERRFAVLAALPALRGKDVACFCAEGLPCHGDVYIELANAPEGEGLHDE